MSKTISRRKGENKMKSKLEKVLDEEFERIGIKPHIYHFFGICPYNAITIATNTEYTYEEILKIITHSIASTFCLSNDVAACKAEIEKQFGGIAICNNSDQFNRKLGRTIAKGRLLKYLILAKNIKGWKLNRK